MSNLIKDLESRGLITPPAFIADNLICLMIAGSESYGLNTSSSDRDIVGICYPRIADIFPSAYGVIGGYDNFEPFKEYQQHHIQDGDMEYDIKIYSLTRYFQLAEQGNPNITDTLFTPRNCIIYSTPQYELLREHRNIFLSKLAYPKYKGYAFSELKNIKNLKTGKRREGVEKLGYDAKNAGHIFRLINFIQMILEEEDLDLYRGREEVKNIRAGQYTFDEIVERFAERELSIEKSYVNSKLRDKPRYDLIRHLLLQLIQMHYKEAQTKINTNPEALKIEQIRKILES